MTNSITSVTENILPGEKVDCIVYGCTSGTIVSGYDNIKKKINIAKPDASVTAPSTAALRALKKKNVNKISIVTPYTKSLNDDVFLKKIISKLLQIHILILSLMLISEK